MKDEKKYWLHRITGGPNATKLSHPLLFEHDILSTGWSSLSYDDFVRNCRDDWKAFEAEFNGEYPGLRNRNCLWRFINMKAGDIVVVPTWGEFSVYKVTDNNVYTCTSLLTIISPDDLRDWNNQRAHITKDNDGYVFLNDEENECIDLGFFRKVEPIAVKLPRQEYANQALFSRMKILQTNADISDIWESVEEAITRGKGHLPIRIHDELVKATLTATQRAITEYTQNIEYENLVEKYLWAIGASDITKPATNETETEYGDADRVAYFEELKVAVMVQVKKHKNITNEWAVEQIIAYKENHQNEDYNVQLWVISNADDFTDEAKQKAITSNVRLINGEDFARMILEVGLKHFE